MSLPVPTTTGGGPGGDTGEGVSLSWALRESGTKICVRRSCFMIVKRCIDILYGCPESGNRPSRVI